jgi:isoamylase
LMVITGAAHRGDVVLPHAPTVTGYELLWDSAEPRPPATRNPQLLPGTNVSTPSNSIHLYRIAAA